MALPTFGDGPPGQRDVREVGVERRGLRALALLPQVEGLCEAAHGPQRVVRAVVQLWNSTHTTSTAYHVNNNVIILSNFLVRSNLL